MTLLSDRQQLSYIASQAADARLNVELETEGMTLNIGPQHPATHGTLRIIARLDGEPGVGRLHEVVAVMVAGNCHDLEAACQRLLQRLHHAAHGDERGVERPAARRARRGRGRGWCWCCTTSRWR